MTRGVLLAVLPLLLAPGVSARGQTNDAALAGGWTAGPRAPTAGPGAPRPPAGPALVDTLPAVDVEARLASFQREFAEAFGAPGGAAAEEEAAVALAERVAARLQERFAGSLVETWTRRGMRLYEWGEGLYERVDSSLEWASSGWDVDARVESMVEGRVAVHAQREVYGLDLGVGMKDAVDGRFGVRLGGEVRGADVSFDVVDVARGRLTFRLDKRFD